jgi:hypothetical protein
MLRHRHALSRGSPPSATAARGPTADEIGREVLRIGLTLCGAALVFGLLAVATGST